MTAGWTQARRHHPPAEAIDAAARIDQPTWKLGIAAYGFTRPSGWAAPAHGEAATTSSKPTRRGGATGKAVITTMPTSPEAATAMTRRVSGRRSRRHATARPSTRKGQ
jgi:hypothetical protein